MERLQRQFIKDVKETKVKFIDTLKSMGTAGATEGFIAGGATPFKNWSIPPETKERWEQLTEGMNYER